MKTIEQRNSHLNIKHNPCMFTYSRVHIFTYSHIHVFTYSHIHVFTYSHIHVCTYVCVSPPSILTSYRGVPGIDVSIRVTIPDNPAYGWRVSIILTGSYTFLKYKYGLLLVYWLCVLVLVLLSQSMIEEDQHGFLMHHSIGNKITTV